MNALTAAGAPFPGLVVSLSSTDFTLSQAATTGTPISVTFPSTPGDYTLIATDPGGTFALGTAEVTIAAPALGTLSISPSGAAVGGIQRVNIIARTADNEIPSGALTVTLSGTGFATTSAILLNGAGIADVRLPATTGTYTLLVNAAEYDQGSTTLTVGVPTIDADTNTDTDTNTNTNSIRAK